MERPRTTWAWLVVLLLAAPPTRAAPARRVDPTRIRFSNRVKPGQPTEIRSAPGLVGGVLAAEGQFPATVGLLLDAEGDGVADHLSCTMTKIGPRRFLLAAHCINQDAAPGRPVRAELRPGRVIAIHVGVRLVKRPDTAALYRSVQFPTTVRAVSVHPSWRRPAAAAGMDPREVRDVDLAVLETVDDVAPAAPAARLSSVARRPGDPLVLQGYGCQSTHHGVTGDLHWAEARAGQVRGAILVTEAETRGARIGICPGDSGGALYEGGGPPPYLTVVGVNSRFLDASVLGSPGPLESLFARLDDGGPAPVSPWLRPWLLPSR